MHTRACIHTHIWRPEENPGWPLKNKKIRIREQPLISYWPELAKWGKLGSPGNTGSQVTLPPQHQDYKALHHAERFIKVEGSNSEPLSCKASTSLAALSY